MFNSNSEVTPQDISNYLTGKLPHKEIHKLEAKALKDPFLADALEGYKAFPKQLKNVPPFSKKIKWSWLISSFSILIIVAIVFLYFNPLKDNSNVTAKKINTSSPTLSEQTTLKTPIINNTKKVIKEVPTKPLLNQENIQKEEKKVPLVREIVNLETYEREPEIYTQESNYNLARVNIKTIAYYNFIAVDYSAIYIDDYQFEEISMGTPAHQANATTSYSLTDEMMLTKTKKFTYKQYLQKSFKHLSKQAYKNAISNFNLILEHYPNDVNAQFYSGFAHFNQSEFSKALPFFDNAMANSFDFFHEDAQWYKALCLENLGKNKEAHKIYQKIYQAKGFYAGQAYQKL